MPHVFTNNRFSRRAALFLAASAGLAAAIRPARAANDLTFSQLYGPATATGISLTPTAEPLVGKTITLRGYMAPPLKAESDFFVLTRFPMSICPFCSNAADWPIDIVVVKLSSASEVISPAYAISVSGTLEFGVKVDPDTGFVSLVRIVDADWQKV